MIYGMWRDHTKYVSSPTDAVDENIHAHALLTFDRMELLPFLFSKIDEWGFFETGLIAACVDNLPDVPRELWGRSGPVHRIYREWGKSMGYLSKTGEA